MIPDFSGDYLNYDGTEDGDMVTILTEGKVEYNETLKKEMFNIDVEHNQKKKVYSPSNKAGKTLQDAFGKDTKNWIGKQFQIIHIDKKMAIRPIKVEKA
jgi:hypothetical protein